MSFKRKMQRQGSGVTRRPIQLTGDQIFEAFGKFIRDMEDSTTPRDFEAQVSEQIVKKHGEEAVRELVRAHYVMFRAYGNLEKLLEKYK